MFMRLSGFVTINGVREHLDWTITGTSVNAGPGLNADQVKVHVSLPDFTNTTGSSLLEVAEVSENPTGGLWDLTVTDLRLKLKQLGLPVYGNKQDLIDRLEGAEAEGNATEEVTEEIVEETVVEVDEDGSKSE
tara:strand:+ start:1405 stop:1803 length:399 start_codon:yes stop_codon:yes gene_type:complete